MTSWFKNIIHIRRIYALTAESAQDLYAQTTELADLFGVSTMWKCIHTWWTKYLSGTSTRSPLNYLSDGLWDRLEMSWLLDCSRSNSSVFLSWKIYLNWQFFDIILALGVSMVWSRWCVQKVCYVVNKCRQHLNSRYSKYSEHWFNVFISYFLFLLFKGIYKFVALVQEPV